MSVQFTIVSHLYLNDLPQHMTGFIMSHGDGSLAHVEAVVDAVELRKLFENSMQFLQLSSLWISQFVSTDSHNKSTIIAAHYCCSVCVYSN